jgi:hypothetical protein
VSLRSEIHSAFDELRPETLGLSERVIQGVVQNRPRRVSWPVHLRAPLSLVAAVLVIAVVAAALMGGRLIRDWNSFIAPHQAAGIQLTALQKLEARPLRLPSVAPRAHCPAGPYDKNGEIGAGPLHFSGSAVETPSSWGNYFHNLMFADRPVTGPIVVRARDLVTGRLIVFVGPNAGGPVVGTDTLMGQVIEQRAELVVQDPMPPYAWQFVSGAANAADCEGWQVDAPGFSEAMVL